MKQEIENMSAYQCGFDFTKRIVQPNGKIRSVWLRALRGFKVRLS